MNPKIYNLYNGLIKLSEDNGYKNNYGMQKLHIGSECQTNTILFVGRENRGHGHSIGDYKGKISNEFVRTDFNWLKIEYPYTKSPFWRVIGKATSVILNQNYDLKIFKQVIWTNLFKISPVTKNANTKKTRNFQRKICWELLTEEIKFLKPKSVIFLTDYWVESFISYWEKNNLISNLQNVDESKYYLQKFEFNFGETKIPALVLPHPQNKKSGASEQNLIQDIIQLNKRQCKNNKGFL